MCILTRKLRERMSLCVGTGVGWVWGVGSSGRRLEAQSHTAVGTQGSAHLCECSTHIGTENIHAAVPHAPQPSVSK
eukprot:SAG11_NODE_5583_length_1517_cov_2.405501_3_plen_76_part_00